MRIKIKYILFICFIFSVTNPGQVMAVTDAELEALEQQIEQQEAEKKQKAEEEAKRKAEAKHKAEAEAKRKAEEERQREAEEKRRAELEKQRLQEEKKKAEEARLAELERQRQEEVKKKAEEEKKQKYNLLIAEAKQAIIDKDKELAISKYNEALTLAPDDSVAISGIKEAEKLKHKVFMTYLVLGYILELN